MPNVSLFHRADAAGLEEPGSNQGEEEVLLLSRGNRTRRSMRDCVSQRGVATCVALRRSRVGIKFIDPMNHTL